jgi:flagellar hook-associated protein 2
VTVSITSDPDAARKVLDDFITKYNDVVSYLRTHSSISSDGKTRAELAGNQTIDTFESQMREIIGSVISGAAAGAPTSLAALGIDIARDGTLSVADGTKFSAALIANPAQAIAVFGGAGGLGSQLFKLADSFTGAKGGLSFENSQITEQLGTMTDRQAVLQDRIDRRRAQLVTQFGQLQNLATQLTQMQQQVNGL